MSIHRQVGKTFDREATGFDGIYSGKKSSTGRLWDRLTRRNVIERFDFTLAELQPFDGMTVFDAGCGSGRFAIAYALEGALHVTGADLSDKMLDIARGIATENGVADRCEFINADIIEFNPDKAFDYVTALGFFDYIPDPQSMLSHLASLTGKKIIASFPMLWAFRTPFRKLWRLRTNTFIRFYTLSQFPELASRAGLTVLKIKVIGPNYILVASPK